MCTGINFSNGQILSLRYSWSLRSLCIGAVETPIVIWCVIFLLEQNQHWYVLATNTDLAMCCMNVKRVTTINLRIHTRYSRYLTTSIYWVQCLKKILVFYAISGFTVLHYTETSILHTNSDTSKVNGVVSIRWLFTISHVTTVVTVKYQ